MKSGKKVAHAFNLSLLQGLLPLNPIQIPMEIVAGLSFAAIAIPQGMGYTKIAGMPVITGVYTLLLPMVAFAIFGSSRHLVVGADSATAAIIASGLATMALPNVHVHRPPAVTLNETPEEFHISTGLYQKI